MQLPSYDGQYSDLIMSEEFKHSDVTGTLAAIFELKQLVDMMNIGTLLAYSIVAASVLILR